MERKKFNHLIAFLALLLSAGCSPSSLEDFHYEGESRCRALIEEMQRIQDRDQLTRAAPALKKHFEDIVVLMIHAREFQESHPDEALPPIAENSTSSALEEELRRIYAMESGREIVEGAEHEALVRLDAFERACVKKRHALTK
jgi:Tfp pilus assembly protein PilP